MNSIFEDLFSLRGLVIDTSVFVKESVCRVLINATGSCRDILHHQITWRGARE